MASDLKLKATRMTGGPVTWAQLSLAAAEDICGLMRRNRYAAELLLQLISRMAPGGAGVVVASRETMRELLGCSMPSVDRALRILAGEGWVQRIKIGGASALAVNSRVAWIGPRGDLSHAVFAATVIASRSEQDALALDPPPMRTVPVLHPDEQPLMVGPGQPPPSQPDLPGVSPVVAVAGGGPTAPARRIDPETGEILSP